MAVLKESAAKGETTKTTNTAHRSIREFRKQRRKKQKPTDDVDKRAKKTTTSTTGVSNPQLLSKSEVPTRNFLHPTEVICTPFMNVSIVLWQRMHKVHNGLDGVTAWMYSC
jgi:hypothetical protein